MSFGALFHWWWRRRGVAASFILPPIPPQPPPPVGPTHDLIWADGNGLTWAGDTIIDWPGI